MPTMRSGETWTRTATIDLAGDTPTAYSPWHRQLAEQLDHLDRPATLLVDPAPGRSRLYVASEGPV